MDLPYEPVIMSWLQVWTQSREVHASVMNWFQHISNFRPPGIRLFHCYKSCWNLCPSLHLSSLTQHVACLQLASSWLCLCFQGMHAVPMGLVFHFSYLPPRSYNKFYLVSIMKGSRTLLVLSEAPQR